MPKTSTTVGASARNILKAIACVWATQPGSVRLRAPSKRCAIKLIVCDYTVVWRRGFAVSPPRDGETRSERAIRPQNRNTLFHSGFS
jgi:hypothetical protein